MANKKVKVYALSTCPWCRKAKQFLKDHSIEFEAIDFDLCDPKKQKECLAEMKLFGAGSSFPVVLIDNQMVEGYNPEKYCELLGIQQ